MLQGEALAAGRGLLVARVEEGLGKIRSLVVRFRCLSSSVCKEVSTACSRSVLFRCVWGAPAAVR